MIEKKRTKAWTCRLLLLPVAVVGSANAATGGSMKDDKRGLGSRPR